MTSRTSMEERRRWAKESRERAEQQGRESSLRIRYGIKFDQKLEMFLKQEGRCANIGCKSIFTLPIEKIHTDHCHKTGKLRGLLCVNCNSALGHLKDDPNRIMGLLDYLGVIKLQNN